MPAEAKYQTIVKNVVKSTLGVQAGENVIVETWDHGLSLATEFVYQLRAVGARPMLVFEHEPTFWRSVKELPEENLGRVGEHEWAAMEKARSYIFIPGPSDLGQLLKNRPKYTAAVGYNASWYDNAKKFRTKGARISLGYATKERARAYGFSLPAWRRMLVQASSIDFSSLRENAVKLSNLLRGSWKVRVTGPRGTDLSFRLANRMPWAEDCVVDHADLELGHNMSNIPGGEVVVAPDESSTEGVVVFDRPTPSLGKWVGGVKWEFKNGQLASWSAQRNPQMFQNPYDKAEGDKNRLGVMSIGFNHAVKPGFLQDDYASGVVKLALGANEDYDGVNKTKFFFAGTLTKATVTIDGQTIVDKGRLVTG